MTDSTNSLCAIYSITPDMTGKPPDYFFRFTQQATGNVLCGENWQFFMNALSDKVNQQWILERHDDTYYRILDIISRLAITADKDGLKLTNDGVNDSQLWSFLPVENTGRFYIMSKVPAPDGSSQWVLDGDGTKLYLSNANGGPFQCWSPAAVPVNYCRIILANEALTSDGKGLWLDGIKTTDDNQLWRFDLLSDNYYRIVHKVTGLVLDGNGTDSCYINGWNTGDYQHWYWGEINDVGSPGLLQKNTRAALSGKPGNNKVQMVSQQELPSTPFELINWTSQSQRPLYLPKSRSYRHVTTAMAHDSHTALKEYGDKEDVPQNVDQTQPIEEQLAGGIRTVRISCGTFNDPDTVILQHGDPNEFGPMCVFGTLNDYLSKVKEFLDNNPNEVITIIDEGDADGYLNYLYHLKNPPQQPDPTIPHDPGTPLTKEEERKGTADFRDKVHHVYQIALPYLIYTDANDIRQGWPSLNDMIASGRRVMVFMANLACLAYPAYYPQGMISMNDYSADQPDGDEKRNRRPIEQDSFFFSNRASNPIDENTLYLMNQQYIHTMAKGWTESWRDFSVWTVGDLLVENTIRAWQITGRKPNFINVDFYQGVNGARSTLIDLVNTLNQCDSSDQVIERWAGSPITIQDYRTRKYPGIPTLQIGRIYKIASAKSQDLYLTKDGQGLLSLQPANDNRNQQWMLKYNSPSYGIALVNQDSGQYLFASFDRDGNSQATIVNSYAGNIGAATAW